MGDEDGSGGRGVVGRLSPAAFHHDALLVRGMRVGVVGGCRVEAGVRFGGVGALASPGAFDALEHAFVALDVPAHLLHAEFEPSALPLDVSPVLLPTRVERDALLVAAARVAGRLIAGLVGVHGVRAGAGGGAGILGEVAGGARAGE